MPRVSSRADERRRRTNDARRERGMPTSDQREPSPRRRCGRCPTSSTRSRFPSVPAALDAVRRRDADAAMVPLENSVEGAIGVTPDELALGDPLVITREVLLPVSFALMASGRHVVRRHPHHRHASACCSSGTPLGRREDAAGGDRCRGVDRRGGSTGERRASTTLPSPHRWPPITTTSRFSSTASTTTTTPSPVSCSYRGRCRHRPQPVATARRLVAFIADDHPGALLEILTQFSVRGINLTRIESRPTGRGPRPLLLLHRLRGTRRRRAGRRSVDRPASRLRGRTVPRFVSVVPISHPTDVAEVPAGISDDEFRDAEAWLARVRDGRSV